MQKGQKIAVIGTGAAGLGAAWLLHGQHDITVYEQNAYTGGHLNTVFAPDGTGIDTEIPAFNPVTSPNLSALLVALEVATHYAGMSFAVSLNDGALEYTDESIGSLFLQPRNYFRPRFYRMWMDIMRFSVEAPFYVKRNPATDFTLGEFLGFKKYGDSLVYDYLLPLGSALWSLPLDAMMAFPLKSFTGYCAANGLLKVGPRFGWQAVTGGSRKLVDRMAEGFKGRIRHRCGVVKIDRSGAKAVVLDSKGARDGYDHVIIATHADEALTMLDRPSPEERRVLSAFRYTRNRLIVHQDARLMPQNKRAWGALNYLGMVGGAEPKASLAHWANKLQGLKGKAQYFVSLNPITEPEKALYENLSQQPLYTKETQAAQGEIQKMQGANRTWYCGAWCGYGFHEDALASGFAVAENFGVARPWEIQESSPAAVNARKAA